MGRNVQFYSERFVKTLQSWCS